MSEDVTPGQKVARRRYGRVSIGALSLVLGAMGVVALSATPAAACEGVGCSSTPDASDEGDRYTLEVTYTYENQPPGGTSPSGDSGGPAPYYPCGYMTFDGETFYDGALPNVGSRGPDGEPYDGPSREELEEHRSDTEGLWYIPYCEWGPQGRELFGDERLQEIHDEFWANNQGTLWVENADPPPPLPPPPPQVLVEYAWDELVVPDPEIHHNPDAHSYVNLDTFMWVEGAEQTQPVGVTASAGPNYATVRVTPEQLTLTADGTSDTCGPEEFTVAYAPGVESECYLTFPHSSAGYEVTASMYWSAEFDSNQGTIEGPADGVDATSDFAVEVREIQTQVTGVD